MLTNQSFLSALIVLLVIERFQVEIRAMLATLFRVLAEALGAMKPLMERLMQSVLAVLPSLVTVAALLLVLLGMWKILSRVYSYWSFRCSMEAVPKPKFSHVDITPGKIKSDVNGLYSELFIGDKEYRLRLEASVSQLLLNTRQSLPVKEMAISTSKFNLQDKLPTGVVSLLVNGEPVGMGSRIVLGNKSYLLTAKHLQQALVGEQTYICSNTRSWRINKCGFWASQDLDLLLVDIPETVWSLLGVKSLSIGEAVPGDTIQLTGYSNGTLAFSVGSLLRAGNMFLLKHTSSTLPSWSGTPVIAKGKVVAVHTGRDAGLHERNDCTGVYHILRMLELSNHESPRGKFAGREIQPEELISNDYSYVEYDVPGIGRILTGNDVFAVDTRKVRDVEKGFKMKPWHLMAEEDDDAFYETAPLWNKESDFNSVVQASSHQSLNFEAPSMQVAELSKPCTPSAVTTSPVVTVPSQKECPSIPVVEVQSPTVAQKPKENLKNSKKAAKSSKSSKSGPGQKWARKPNAQASNSKPQGLPQPVNPQVSGSQSKNSSRYTPPHRRQKPVGSGLVKS